ncbi:hypothetical protein MmiHf6_12080 [Methanimicrococcus hongohii]|uniref:Polymer-forming cytoskeletal protein n=2 Tax=Methanimicrococcus hongohii TaxID=3028295 RepID=A0AA96ZSX4_9EURY|nr:hypothetical protein MmiHf6_12080 [Methanimicrococcus sp. Hf6]
MISSKNIRFHSPSNTYIIPKNSIIDQNVTVKGNVIAGPGVRFWKNIKVNGNIQLGKGCLVEGNLTADKIIIGSRSKIKGNIKADSDVSLFQNVIVNSVESGGNITIMPECVVGYANSSTLTVIGKADIKKIGVITKVTVRANTVAELEKEDEKDEENGNEYENGNEKEITDYIKDIKGIQDIKGAQDVKNTQTVSEELIFENNISDEIKAESIESHINKNESVSRANSPDSQPLSTPAFPMETASENIQLGTETDLQSEEFDVEIIDETDESSPKSFTVSAFAGSQTDRPVSVPTAESDEVEIVGETGDDIDSESETIPQTVETPFGTIVVGEKPVSRRNIRENSRENSKESAKNTAASVKNTTESTKNTTDSPSNNQFASVTEISKEEQQADYEAEIRSKSGAKTVPTVSMSDFVSKSVTESAPESAPESASAVSAPAAANAHTPANTPALATKSAPASESASAARKSEFRWPAFEPKKMPKAENQKQQTPFSKKSSNWPDDEHFNQMKVSSVHVQYEEIKIQNAPKQKENLFEQKIFQNNKSGKPDAFANANRQIVFEEVGYSPAVPVKQQKSKAEILMEQMNFDAVPSPAETEMKKKPEKKERSREEVERSKIWYEERYPQSESDKKEYPPYV